MKVLFITNIPSPYRVEFFNELSKYCDLTVCYERKSSSERDGKWKGQQDGNYTVVYPDLKPVGVDQSKGSELRKLIAGAEFDHLIITNYASPAVMEAILYCRLKRIQYIMEYDGGFNKVDSFPKRILKKLLLCGAKAHLTTCEQHIDYLLSLGISRGKIYKYPFTSIRESDIQKAGTIPTVVKTKLRQQLGVTEEKMLLSIGRFSYEGGYGKGYDVLLNVAERLPENVGVYIVGDDPTDEFVRMKEERNLKNIHYVGFRLKDALADYYAAADLMILLTRGDVWGLVVNEAMSFGVPVITSQYCVAGLEMIENGVNGYVVKLENIEEITSRVTELLNEADSTLLAQNCLHKAKQYTIENMTKCHMDNLSKISGGVLLGKQWFKHLIGITEKQMILSVGQFVPRKGFDILMEAMTHFAGDVAVCIVGGKPSEEYLQKREELNLGHLYFVDFKKKEDLACYYSAADIFVLPTREDIWGLVINEAMSFGLPVITTDKCIAGLELIDDGKNGYIVPSNDSDALSGAMNKLLEDEYLISKMRCASTEKISKYTIERMASTHMKMLNSCQYH